MTQEIFRRYISKLGIGIITAVIFTTLNSLAALPFYWRSTTSGEWTTPGNWDRNSSYPQATNGDSAIFDTSAGS
jgi:hypothetical protein